MNTDYDPEAAPSSTLIDGLTEKPREKWAIVRNIPQSMNGGCLQENESAIDIQRAKEQHEVYIECLKSIISNVLVVEADEAYPDCVFIEDPVVIVGETALINNLGHPSRRGEYEGLLEVLKNLGLKIVLMPQGGEACLDGGDVLQCGSDIFVGLSTRTNEKGLAFLQETFPQCTVIGIRVPRGLHLKSFVSCASQDYLITSSDSNAQQVADEIAEYHNFSKVISVPDAGAANLLYVVGDNGQGLVLARKDYPDSLSILEEQLPFEVLGIDMSEDEKADGAITCHSVLWCPF